MFRILGAFCWIGEEVWVFEEVRGLGLRGTWLGGEAVVRVNRARRGNNILLNLMWNFSWEK